MHSAHRRQRSNGRILGVLAFAIMVVAALAIGVWYATAGSDSNTPAAVENAGSAKPTTNAKPSIAATSSAPSVPSGRTIERTFDDLKFEMETGGEYRQTMLTPPITDLFGKKIRIRGYILPTDFQDGIKQFVLVRDNLECCFGPGAALYDCILVEMEGDRTASYTVRPVTVEGTFQSREIVGPDGKHIAIFGLTAEAVK